MPISQKEAYFKNPQNCFSEEPILFLLALKWNLYNKVFSYVKTKTNSYFAIKAVEWSIRSFSVYLMNNLV